MIAFLAARSLLRSRTRTALTLLGVGVAGALLLDMSMLAHGLEDSLGRLLGEMGFDVRVTPAGTLPFETDATFANGHALAASIAARPDVREVGALVGGTLYARRPEDRLEAGRPLFVFGLDRGARPVYRAVRGTDLPGLGVGRARGPRVVAARGETPLLVNAEMARALGLEPGARLLLAPRPFETLPSSRAPVIGRVLGIADVRFDAPGQRTAILPLDAAQRILDLDAEDRVSVLAVRLEPGASADALARWVVATHPDVSAYSMAALLAAVRRQLSYFTQFSLVLGSTSMIVVALLLGTIVTLSVRARLGEIATLRAIGVSAGRIRALVTCESLALTVASLPLALGLGLLVARVLDDLLRQAPGLPADMHFFVLTGPALGRTVALLLAAGAGAALYPASLAARVPIAATLHEEVT